MVTEAAFLEALKAAPADDTTRLVYADWLDDNGRPQEAEYLRLVAQLTHTCAESTREQPEAARVLQLAEQLPQEWRVSVGSRFMVVFYDCPDPTKKIATIKLIRMATGMGLVEAKDAFEQRPRKLLVGVPFEKALACREILLRGLPELVVLIHPVDLAKLPYRGSYALVASRNTWASGEQRVADTVFSAFLQATLRITPEAARELAAQHTVTLADNLDLPTARAYHAEVSQLISTNEPILPGVWVSIHVTVHPTND